MSPQLNYDLREHKQNYLIKRIANFKQSLRLECHLSLFYFSSLVAFFINSKMHPVFPNLILFSHVHHFVKCVVFCHELEMFPLQAGSRGISGPSCSYRSEYCPVSGTPVIDCSLNWCTCCVLCPKDLCQFVEWTTVYSSLSFLSLPPRSLLWVTQMGDISHELSFCMVFALIFMFQGSWLRGYGFNPQVLSVPKRMFWILIPCIWLGEFWRR